MNIRIRRVAIYNYCPNGFFSEKQMSKASNEYIIKKTEALNSARFMRENG